MEQATPEVLRAEAGEKQGVARGLEERVRDHDAEQEHRGREDGTPRGRHGLQIPITRGACVVGSRAR